MQDFKDTVKDWLKSIEKDREWLGRQLEYTPKRTIDRWLAPYSGPIPAWAELSIKKLIASRADEDIQITENGDLKFQLEFSPEEKQLIEEYAKTHPRFDPKTFAEERILEFCAELIAREKTESSDKHRKAAESPGAYDGE